MRAFSFVIDSLDYSGNARLLLSLCNYLKQKQHKVSIICLGKPTPWSQIMQSSDIPLEHLNSNGLWDVSSLLKLRTWLGKLEEHELHAVSLNALESISLASPSCLPKCILWGLPIKPVKYGFLRRKLLPRAKAILCQTKAQMQMLEKAGISDNTLKHLSPGLQTLEFTESHEPDFYKPYMLDAGPFRQEIDHISSLWSLEILQFVFPKVHLCLTGSGKDLQRLQSFSTTLEASKRIHFLGPVKYQEPWLEKCSVFLSTRIQPGGLVSIMEAMHAAKPIIATNVAGTEEFLQDGQNALFIDPKDKAGLAKQARKVLENPDLAQDLGNRAAEYAKRHFTAEAHYNRLMNLLESL